MSEKSKRVVDSTQLLRRSTRNKPEVQDESHNTISCQVTQSAAIPDMLSTSISDQHPNLEDEIYQTQFTQLLEEDFNEQEILQSNQAVNTSQRTVYNPACLLLNPGISINEMHHQEFSRFSAPDISVEEDIPNSQAFEDSIVGTVPDCEQYDNGGTTSIEEDLRTMSISAMELGQGEVVGPAQPGQRVEAAPISSATEPGHEVEAGPAELGQRVEAEPTSSATEPGQGVVAGPEEPGQRVEAEPIRRSHVDSKNKTYRIQKQRSSQIGKKFFHSTPKSGPNAKETFMQEVNERFPSYVKFGQTA